MRISAILVLLLLCVGVVSVLAAKPKKQLSDAELDKLLASMNREEFEETRNKKSPHARHAGKGLNKKKFDPKNFDPSSLLAQTKAGTPMMIMGILKHPSTREYAEGLAIIWNEGLTQAFIKAQSYVISEEMIMFHLEDGGDIPMAKEFLFLQPEVDHVEYETQKFYRPGEKPRDEV